jgi:hypothetical protein
MGNLVQPFQRLADWKTKRNLKSHIVTVSNIVAGVYGNFSSGVRDLQEVIRNFLKWALGAWGISWRAVRGMISASFQCDVWQVIFCGESNFSLQIPPPANQSFWTGTFLKVSLVSVS